MVVCIDNGHGYDTAGKCSPDKSLMEWEYTREIAARVGASLMNNGVRIKMVTPEVNDVSLKERCRRVNAETQASGVSETLVVSIHVNAAGSDGKWHNAGGWCAYTTPGDTRSDVLAECLYDSARKHLGVYSERMNAYKKFGFYGDRQRAVRTDTTDGDSDMEANFYILRNTWCAAVLTENMFMDSYKDCEWLLSEEGKETVVQIHVDGIMDYINNSNNGK